MSRISPSTTTLPGLCRWALGYAWRRGWALVVVLLTLLLRVGIDLLKPWPLVFLVDYVLMGKSSALAARVAEALPGSPTTHGLILWSVGATIALFLFSWAAGLANAYASISLGQRMVYDLAAELFGRLQRVSLRYHSRRPVGDSLRRLTKDCNCVSTIVVDTLLPLATTLLSLATMFAIMWRTYVRPRPAAVR